MINLWRLRADEGNAGLNNTYSHVETKEHWGTRVTLDFVFWSMYNMRSCFQVETLTWLRENQQDSALKQTLHLQMFWSLAPCLHVSHVLQSCGFSFCIQQSNISSREVSVTKGKILWFQISLTNLLDPDIHSGQHQVIKPASPHEVRRRKATQARLFIQGTSGLQSAAAGRSLRWASWCEPVCCGGTHSELCPGCSSD